MKHIYLIMMSLALIVSVSVTNVGAQYDIPNGTFSNGGGFRSGSNFCFDTAGQALVLNSCGDASYIVKSGFWYLAEISSTVDVAITSFNSRYDNDAVMLFWDIKDSMELEGLNIYRAESGENELVIINGELIPGDGPREYVDMDIIPGRTYRYQLGAVETGGTEWKSCTISISVPPRPITLYQNYPNPFNPSTSISFFLPDPVHVTMAVYNTEGRLVKTLLEKKMGLGKHTVVWNGENNRGKPTVSGIYFCRFVAGKKAMTNKLVLIR